MPWTSAIFKNDTDDPEIGTVIATFVSEDGTSFQFSKRVKQISKEHEDFVNEAKQAVLEWEKARTDEKEEASPILDALNS